MGLSRKSRIKGFRYGAGAGPLAARESPSRPLRPGRVIVLDRIDVPGARA
jgi:hypothetical protein